MVDWRNETGRPLASAEWLEAHHRAKVIERRHYVEMLADFRPERVVDLGCGPGWWLELLHEVLPAACELVGVDADYDALALARERSAGWRRRVTLEHLDLDSDREAIPAGDMTLAFNVFSYLKDPAGLMSAVAGKGGALAIRQYDGGALRFGPIEPRLRSAIEASLRASVSPSDQFRHYDMDHVFGLLETAPFTKRKVDFELYSRTAPFPEDFVPYYERMLAWTLDLLSEDAAKSLRSWLADGRSASCGRYFFEVDLTAVLS